jgi:hypothetical protein
MSKDTVRNFMKLAAPYLPPVPPMEFSCLQGFVDATYAELVNAFGKPLYGPNDPGDKVTCEWEIEENGVRATIYDWYEHETPLRLYRWHVGGTSLKSVFLVESRLAEFRKGTDVQPATA